MNSTDRLLKVGIFQGLTEAQIAAVQEMMVEDSFCKGECLFSQDQTAEWLFLLLKGWVKMIRQSANGADTIIEVFSAGDELTASFLIEGRSYIASAQGLTDGLIIKVSKDNFMRLLGNWPALSGNIMREMGTKCRKLMENLTSLAVYNGQGRLCNVIVDLTRRYGVFGDSRGVILDLCLTRQDLADICGTTPETTFRTLRRLREERLIAWEGRRFYIPDVRVLEEFVLDNKRRSPTNQARTGEFLTA